jgi:hypothetical protein
MQEQTGAIARFETDDDAKAAGYELPLTDQQAAKLSDMNRHDRRKWAAKERARQSALRSGRKR